MRVSTVAQGPAVPCLEYIRIGASIYSMETLADYAAATGALRTLLDERTLGAAVDREMQAITDRQRARLLAQNGVPVVPAHAVMRAARALNRLTQIETWISNNKASNDLALRLAYGAENITQAELVAVDATQGTVMFAAARAL
jgi:hypothetical protein